MTSSAMGMSHPTGQWRMCSVTGWRKSTTVSCLVVRRIVMAMMMMARAYHSAINQLLRPRCIHTRQTSEKGD